jgi:hypothetical protein
MNVIPNARRTIGWRIFRLGQRWIAEFCDGYFIYSASAEGRSKATNDLKDQLREWGVSYK